MHKNEVQSKIHNPTDNKPRINDVLKIYRKSVTY